MKLSKEEMLQKFEAARERLPTNSKYSVNNDGLPCIVKDEEDTEPLANFLPIPVKDILRTDGLNEKRLVQLEGIVNLAQYGTHSLPKVDVPAIDLPKMEWPIDKWGMKVKIEPGLRNKENLRAFIQDLSAEIPVEQVHTNIGWVRIDGTYCYIHAGGVIGDIKIITEPHRYLSKYDLSTDITNSYQAAKASFDMIAAGKLHVTIPIISLVYLSPLIEAFRSADLEPRFVLWLSGTTGTLKTSTALAFLNHFGKFMSPPASFKDTYNSLEKKAFLAKDTLLLLDDFHPSSSSKEASGMSNLCQNVLRAYGDRVGRGRMNASLDLEQSFPPRGMLIITGEDFPQGHSSAARILTIQLKPGDIDKARLGKAQQSGACLNKAMVDYIYWLIRQMDLLKENLPKRFLQYRSQFQKLGVHGRTGDAVAFLRIGFDYFLSYMKYAKVCTEEKAQMLSNMADKIFLKMIDQQNNILNLEDPVDLFIRTVSDLLLAKKVYVSDAKSGSTPLNLPPSSVRIGWQDSTFYYLIPEVTFNEVCKVLTGCFPGSKTNLWRLLAEANAIAVEIAKDGTVQRTVKATVNSDGKIIRDRFIKLYKSKLDQHTADREDEQPNASSAP